MQRAAKAIPLFENKLELLSSQRGEIGAHQKRVEIAASVLEQNQAQFKEAASRITDADVAEEVAKLVRLNILQQASVSILASSNSQPDIVLSLLQ